MAAGGVGAAAADNMVSEQWMAQEAVYALQVRCFSEQYQPTRASLGHASSTMANPAWQGYFTFTETCWWGVRNHVHYQQ